MEVEREGDVRFVTVGVFGMGENFIFSRLVYFFIVLFCGVR